MNIWKPDVITCGPGGIKGLYFVGALKRLFEEDGFMDDVKIWTGVSVGAAISLLLVVGYTVNDIIELCIDVNLLDDILGINLNEAQEKLGFIKNKTVEEKLKHYISLKYGYIPSLGQLYMLTGIHLSLVTFNLDKMRPQFLDKDSEPELSCVEAAMMSMAVPILMQPRKYKGDVFIDGAIGSPYPVTQFDYNGNKVLGLYISPDEDLYCSEKKTTSFLYKLIQSSMKIIRDNEIKYASLNVKHIALKTMVRDTTGIMVDRESRLLMIDHGYACADAFLKVNSNPEKYEINLLENEEIPFFPFGKDEKDT